MVTGAGVVCPIGRTIDDVFDALAAARPAIGPLDRFATARLRTRVGGQIPLATVIDELGFRRVQAPFFAEPVELADNPKLVFALGACAQALGWPPHRPAPAWGRRVGLYTTAGLEEVSLDGLWQPSGGERILVREVPPTFVGEILCHCFGLSDRPPVSFVSACASSTQAIGEAFRAIRYGDADLILAGGTDSMLFPFGINAFNSLGALAEGGAGEARLAPFDEDRQGTLLGEGAAYVLLASETAAAELGLTARAEVVGYGSSLDGYHPVMPEPGGRGAAEAVRRALAGADMTPDEVDYVNAHGSGTRHNDGAEARALVDVFGPGAADLAVSSTKPYYGHLLTAGGAVELLSLLFAFERGQVPPTLNLARRDRSVPFDGVPSQPRTMQVRRAASNSFGLHGQNGVLVLAATETDDHAHR